MTAAGPSGGDDARWQRLQRVFAQALDRPASDRTAWVEAAVPDDDALRAELLGLLDADAAGGVAMTGTVGAAASTLLLPRHPLLGRRLGAWRLVRHLADGGMGAVYLAERDDGVFSQRAAVKLLHPLALAPDAMLRFERERQILAQLSHPAIAALIDGGTTEDGMPYLVMAYVDGEPIDHWCVRQSPSIERRLRLVAEVCDAVAQAHRQLVVHRDLKPANVLVDPQGRPWLLDFGIAKLLQDDAGHATRAGQQLLTPSHAAPEQIRGEPVSTATDVYALGVLLYQLLTGTEPFPQRSLASLDLLKRSLETDPPPPSQRVADPVLCRRLQGDLDTLVLCAMHRDPLRRYASAAALADELRRHLAHQPLSARRDDWRYRAGRFLRRHRAGAVLAALAVALGSTMVAYHAHRLDAERVLAQQARQAAERTLAFLEQVFAAADPLAGGAPAGVGALVDAGVQRVDRELVGQPLVRARMLHALGTVLVHQGRLTDGAGLLERAIALRQALPTLPLDEQIDSLRALAEAQLDLADLAGATRRIDEALALEARRSPTDGASVAQTRHVRARLHGLGGDTPAALAELDAALRELAAAGQDRSLLHARMLGERGRWRSHGGDFTGGLTDGRSALALKLGLDTTAGPDIAMEYLNIGVAEMQLGRTADAEQALRAALDHARTNGYLGHDRVIEPLLSQLGRLYTETGRLDAAEPLLTEARERSLRLVGDAHPDHAYALVNLARLRRDQRRFDDVERLLQQADAVYAAAGDAWRAYRLGATLLRAWSRLDADDAASARALLGPVRLAYAADPALAPGGLSGHADSLLGAALWQLGLRSDASRLLQGGHDTLLAARGAAHHLTRAAAARLAMTVPSTR